MHAVDDERGVLTSDPNLTFKHDYPPTKLMFIPDKEGSRPDLLATTGEFLRIWQITEDNVRMELLLNNVRARPHACSLLLQLHALMLATLCEAAQRARLMPKLTRTVYAPCTEQTERVLRPPDIFRLE